MKKVYIRSNGCIDNLLDGKSFRNYFKENGWGIVQDPSEAEIILLNSCAFDKKHEDISIADIEELMKYKGSQLVVAGCLPGFASARDLCAEPAMGTVGYPRVAVSVHPQRRRDRRARARARGPVLQSGGYCGRPALAEPDPGAAWAR